MRHSTVLSLLVVAAASSVGFAREPQELQLFAPDGARCMFATAGGQKPYSTIYARGEGAAAANGRLFCLQHQGCICQVRYADLPEAVDPMHLGELVARYGFQSWSKEGQLNSLGPIKAGDRQGEAYKVTGLKPEILVRVFVAGRRVFFVSASYRREIDPDAELHASEFLDSFRITKD